MLEIGKSWTFAAGHQLWRDDWTEEDNETVFGRCSRRHGHNYTLTVAVMGPVNADNAMIMNYYDLDAVVRERIIARWDHYHLNDVEPFKDGMLPTAENMVQAVRNILNVAPEFQGLVRLAGVQVQETDKTFAKWWQ